MQRVRHLSIGIIMASLIASSATAQSCELRTRMMAAQQREQQRRLNGIDQRIESLQYLNDLERACLEHFPEYPTQWLGNSAVMIAAFKKIKQDSCQALAEKARRASPAAIQAARMDAQRQLEALSSPVPALSTFDHSKQAEHLGMPRKDGSHKPRRGLIERLTRLFQ